MLDHPPLQRVSSDAQELGRLDDAACAIEGLRAQELLGFAEVEVFQEDRHDQRICEIELVGHPYCVFSTTFQTRLLTAHLRSYILRVKSCSTERVRYVMQCPRGSTKELKVTPIKHPGVWHEIDHSGWLVRSSFNDSESTILDGHLRPASERSRALDCADSLGSGSK